LIFAWVDSGSEIRVASYNFDDLAFDYVYSLGSSEVLEQKVNPIVLRADNSRMILAGTTYLGSQYYGFTTSFDLVGGAHSVGSTYDGGADGMAVTAIYETNGDFWVGVS
jgi:hypothetical protein